jgi:HK97 gp10 family phage protein
MIRLAAHITGLDTLQMDLQNKVTPDKVQQMLKQAAILIEAEAERMCPVGHPFGGRLQKSITHYQSGQNEYTIVANTDYAEYVEYGTSRIAIGTPKEPLVYVSGSGKYPSYRPFLRAALHSTEQRVSEFIDSQL